MADGKVVIEIQMNDGQVVKGVADIKDQLNGIAPPAQKANLGIKDIVTSLGLVKVASVAFNILKTSMDAAISRFDTMQKFPKVMDALGFSTEDSTRSVNKLADGIDGLPTKLDDVVSTAQRMTSVTGNLNKSTNATLALNNAMLASGASADDAKRGAEQYIQMLSTGKVDMQSWKTLQETMPIGLQKTAEAMGFVGETAQRDLYSALQSGKITFNDFQDALIELGTGTGELAALAKINSEGISTSFSNLQNSASKGLANILEKLNDLSIAVTGNSIAKNIDNMKVIVNKSFNDMGGAIEKVTPLVKFCYDAFMLLVSAGKTLSPIIMGVVAGYTALKVIQGVNSLLTRTNNLFWDAGMSGKALNIVLKAQTTAQVANETATKASTLAAMAQNGQITIGTALMGVLTGNVTAYTVASTLASQANILFKATLSALTGPIGWAVVGITAVVAGATALWKWFKKDSEETKKLKKEQEQLTESTKALNDATTENIQNRKNQLTSIESNAKANQQLIDSVSELAKKESLTAGEKKLLKEQVEQLNSAYSDLNLQYNEETGNLSMSNEALQAKLQTYKEQEKLTEGQQQLLDISKEQAEVDAKLGEAAELREKYNEQLNGSIKEANAARDGLKELDEQEDTLIETQKALQEEYTLTSETVKTTSEALATAIEESNARQVITYESLTETQRTAVDNMRTAFEQLHETATNAFEKISNQSEISLNEMVENMQHNQQVTQEWGENQAKLLEWAGKNGYDSFIPFIESIGIDQAGVLAEMVQGVDGSNQQQAALLEQLAKTYDNGFGTAAEAGKKAMTEGLADVPDEVRNMVIKPTDSLNKEVKTAFEGMGKNVGQGAKQGIESGKKEVENTSKELATGVADAFADPLGIHSPSRKFIEYGKNINQGLGNGISLTANNSVNAMVKLSTDLVRPFDNIRNGMYNVGINCMLGLANGLTANASYVYSVADNIAYNVKRTIQSAMDIHSPSRWFKNFIGKNMMLGWGKGLEEYSSLPINAMKKATDKVKLPIFHAESLVGNIPTVNRQVLNNTNNQSLTTINNEPKITMNVTWKGKEDIRKTMQEIAWATEVEGRGGLA